MAECKDHCPEHDARTKLLIENAACISAIKREREHQFQAMREEATTIFTKIEKLENGKVDNGMFKWLMSAVGVVAMLILVTLMAQASTMSEIKADLRVLTAESKTVQ